MEQYQRLSGFLIINFDQFFSHYFSAFLLMILNETVILAWCLYSGTETDFCAVKFCSVAVKIYYGKHILYGLHRKNPSQ